MLWLKLYKTRLLSFVGLFQLCKAIWREGINLMTLSAWAAHIHPTRIAVVDEKERISYQTLYKESLSLAKSLDQQGLQARTKVAVMARNQADLLRCLLALSRCGADIFLLNVETRAEQFSRLQERFGFSVLFLEEDLIALTETAGYQGQRFLLSQISLFLEERPSVTLPRRFGGKLVVLTGGSTGDPKPAERKPSLLQFLSPFFALIDKVGLDRYRSVYIATPIYHGFGLATVFAGMALGASLYLRRRFEAKEACDLIASAQIEVATLVPLMLKRMLQQAPEKLSSVGAFLTGAAPLRPDVVLLAQQLLGERLYNLYGTSEAGFCIMATPQDLRYAVKTIGKAVSGVRLSILDMNNRPVTTGSVGRICIKAAWSVRQNAYVETGDLGYCDASGYLFLCGRSDDMIVSGGENVYPLELENILLQHPDIEQAAVVGVEDADFGQRLRAFVQLRTGAVLDANTLLVWLKPLCTRYQMPREIVFKEELPFSVLGKINKKNLLL